MELIEAKKLAVKLMDAYGLIDDGWTFDFDNSKRRFGVCMIRRKNPELNGKIKLSKYLVSRNDEKRVRNTILHEIAHALTPGHHHDYIWKAKAIEIGCDGKRCYDEESVNVVESKYIAVCNSCNTTHRAFKRPRTKKSCGKCCPRFNAKYVLEFKLNPKY